MNFSTALQELKNNSCVARSGWNGKNMFLFLVPEGEFSHPSVKEPVTAQPYIAMFTAQRTLVPWFASQSDLLAEDWEVVKPQ
jgi:hypothetical protein